VPHTPRGGPAGTTPASQPDGQAAKVVEAVTRQLGAVIAVLLAGILGLAWWLWWRHRPGGEPVARFRRGRVVLVAAGLVIIAVGAVWRLTIAIQPVAACSPPGGAQASARSGGFDASLLAQQVATWPETGIGLLYARAGGARVCVSVAADYYVAVHADYLGGVRAMNMGDITLTPGFNISREELRTLVGHEARHREQWAVGTAIGGPLAFPVAYGIDDFFFPGARNHFERWAGLGSGGYSHEGTGPVLGPAQLAALGVLAAVIVGALLAARHRRASARSPADADTPGAGTDQNDRRTHA
jgi:hypothetical protein